MHASGTDTSDIRETTEFRSGFQHRSLPNGLSGVGYVGRQHILCDDVEVTRSLTISLRPFNGFDLSYRYNSVSGIDSSPVSLPNSTQLITSFPSPISLRSRYATRTPTLSASASAMICAWSASFPHGSTSWRQKSSVVSGRKVLGERRKGEKRSVWERM